MASLEENINQAITDFNGIKEALEESGVPVPYDTDTSEYGKLIKSIPNYDKGYEAGKQAEYDAFWDVYQNNGSGPVSNYGCAFYGEHWCDDTFNPKYDIRCTSASSGYRVFYRSAISNIAKKLSDKNLKIIIGPSCKSLEAMFSLCDTREIPPLETSHCTIFNYFAGCDGRNRLVTVHKIDMSSATSATGMFSKCGGLKNINFEGEIPITVSFSASPLTVESMKSIITHLKNFAGTDEEFTYKVTFSSACITALEAEGATSPNGNSWLDYMTDLGWSFQ